jgi:hypothetical protein
MSANVIVPVWSEAIEQRWVRAGGKRIRMASSDFHFRKSSRYGMHVLAGLYQSSLKLSIIYISLWAKVDGKTILQPTRPQLMIIMIHQEKVFASFYHYFTFAAQIELRAGATCSIPGN